MVGERRAPVKRSTNSVEVRTFLGDLDPKVLGKRSCFVSGCGATIT